MALSIEDAVPYKDVLPGQLWTKCPRKDWVALKNHPLHSWPSKEIERFCNRLSTVVIDRLTPELVGETYVEKDDSPVWVLTYDELVIKED